MQPVASGARSQRIDVSEDYHMLVVVDCEDSNTTYPLSVIVDFHPPPPPPPGPLLGCAATEAALCGGAKASSAAACARCITAENTSLTAANCTPTSAAAFCHGAPPSIPRTCPALDSSELHATLPKTHVAAGSAFAWANGTCDDGYKVNDGSIHFYCKGFGPREMCMVDAAGNAGWESFQCPCMRIKHA